MVNKASRTPTSIKFYENSKRFSGNWKIIRICILPFNYSFTTSSSISFFISINQINKVLINWSIFLKTKEIYNQKCLEIIEYTLSIAGVQSDRLFKELLIITSLIIQGKTQGSTSEEVKMESAKCQIRLFSFPLNSSIIQKIRNLEFSMELSHCVSVLLDG